MLNLFISNTYAQAAAAGQQPNGIMQFAPFIIIFVIFYFMMIRPQKKKMDQEQAMINELKKGDEVYTKSGVLGSISGLTDKIVTLEVADGVKIKVLKHQVAGLSKPLFEKVEKDSK